MRALAQPRGYTGTSDRRLDLVGSDLPEPSVGCCSDFIEPNGNRLERLTCPAEVRF